MTQWSPVRRAVAVAATLGWLAAVLTGYYATHKPLPGDPAAGRAAWETFQHGWSAAVAVPALLDAHLDLGAATWLIAAALGCGILLLDAVLGAPPPRLLERAVFSTALGLAAVSLAFFGLGAAGQLGRLQAFGVMGGLSVLALAGLRRLPWGPIVRARFLVPHAGRGAWVRAVQAALLAIFVLALLRALTPPLAWDALVYHLTGPQRFIERGGFFGGLDIPHAYFPGLMEGLFTAGLLLKSDVAAQVTHLAVAGVALLAVYAFAAHRLTPAAGWTALALLATSGSLVGLATQPYVEWGVMLYGFLAFWALDEALARDDPRRLALSGLLAGCALAAKYTAVGVVAPLGIYLLARALRSARRTPARRFPGWPGVLAWGGAACLPPLPWLLRNALWTGNPVYPFVFGGWNWDGWKAAWFSRPGTGLIAEPWRLATVPWDLTTAVQGAGFDVDLGPLFLGLAPLAVIVAVRAPWVTAARLVVLLGFALWLLGVAQSELLQQGRLLLPVLPFLALLLAAAIGGAWRLALLQLRLHLLLPPVMGLVLALVLLRFGLGTLAEPPFPVLLGAETRPAYLERRLGEHYRALDFVNRALPPDARVLMLWEPRSYLCRRPCQPDALLFNWRHALFVASDNIDRVYGDWRGAGYTHVLLYGGGLRFFAAGPRPEVDAIAVEALVRLEARRLERLYGPALLETLAAPPATVAGEAYTVYRITPEGGR